MMSSDYPRMIPAQIQYAGDYAVVVPTDPQAKVAVLNTTGRAVLERCDGSTPVPEICVAIAEEFGKPLDEVREDVESFLRQATGLLDPAG